METAKAQVNLLLVEDDHRDADLFAAAVKRTNLPVTVIRVWDGQVAVDYLRGTGEYADRSKCPLPGLIVLDVHLPRMDGLAFLQWCKDSPFSSIPIIVLTADRASFSDCIKFGVLCAFVKEGDPQEFGSVVEEICEFGLAYER